MGPTISMPRAIVRSLLLHGARPDSKGKIEFFVGVSQSDDSDASVDSHGHINTSDSETAPLETAAKSRNVWNTSKYIPRKISIGELRSCVTGKCSNGV